MTSSFDGDLSHWDEEEGRRGKVSEHTPGPWRIEGSVILDSGDEPVCIIADPNKATDGERIGWPWVFQQTPPASFEKAEENARLIAAAPDLLAALESLLHQYRVARPQIFGTDQYEEEAREALAKAKEAKT